MNILEKIQGIHLQNSFTLDTQKFDTTEILQDKDGDAQLQQELVKLKHSLNDATSPAYQYIKKLHKEGLLGLENSELDKVVNPNSGIFSHLISATFSVILSRISLTLINYRQI